MTEHSKNQLEAIPSGPYRGLWLWITEHSAILLGSDLPKNTKYEPPIPRDTGIRLVKDEKE